MAELGTISGTIKIAYDRSGIAQASSDTEEFGNRSDRSGERGRAAWASINRAAVAASLAIGAAIVAWGASTIQAIGNMDRLRGQTEAALESMDVAWTDVDSIHSYADAIEDVTGVEAEAVIEGQNLLLTFGDVRNEVGAGNNIFDRATDALTDMSVALGTDTTSAATLVGKALNDPIAGLASLTRVGVQFTDGQKEMIRSLVESGDTLGAQRVILEELEAQFGGSAEAFGQTLPGQIAIARNAFGEASEEILASLIPALTSLVTNLQGIAAWMGDNTGTVTVLVGVLGSLAAAVLVLNGVLAVWRAAVVVATAVQWLWNTAMTANPIGIIIVAIAALVAAIIWIATKTTWFQDLWNWIWGKIGDPVMAVVDFIVGAWNWIVNAFQTSLDFIVNLWNTVWGAIRDFVVSVWDAIWGAIGPPLTAIVEFINWNINFILGIWSSVWGSIKTVVMTVWNFIWGFVSFYIGLIKDVITFVLEAIWAYWQFIWNALSGPVTAVWDFVWNIVSTTIELVRGIIEEVLNIVKAVWSAAWNDVKSVITTVWDFVWNVVSTTIELVKSIIKAGVDFVVNNWTTAWNRVKTIVQTVVDAIKAIVQGAVDRVKSIMDGISGIIATVRNAFNNAKQAAIDKAAELISYVRELPGRIKDALGNLASKLYSAGQDIIRGLINGIKNMATSAANAAVDAVRGALDAARNALGIGSPSRVFRDQIGRWIPIGLAKGVEAEADVPRRAVERMLVSLTSTPPVSTRTALAVGDTRGGDGAYSTSYTFQPGSVVLDASKLRSIQDVVDLIDNLRPTARQFVRRG